MAVARYLLLAAIASGTFSASASAQECVGDCDGDREVVVSEIVSGVNVALGQAALESCVAADANGDGDVAINEVVTAVNDGLFGCLPRPGSWGASSGSSTDEIYTGMGFWVLPGGMAFEPGSSSYSCDGFHFAIYGRPLGVEPIPIVDGVFSYGYFVGTFNSSVTASGVFTVCDFEIPWTATWRAPLPSCELTGLSPCE